MPIDEFKEALNDFYLIELKPTSNLMRSGSSYLVLQAPVPSVSLTIIEHTNPCRPLGEIELGNPDFYLGYKAKDGCAGQTGFVQTAKSLHPVTERRLRELFAKHLPAK